MHIFIPVRKAFGDFVSDWKTERFVERYDFVVIQIISIVSLIVLGMFSILHPSDK